MSHMSDAYLDTPARFRTHLRRTNARDLDCIALFGSVPARRAVLRELTRRNQRAASPAAFARPHAGIA